MKLTSLILAAAITPASLAAAAVTAGSYTLASHSTLTSKACLSPCTCAYQEVTGQLAGGFSLTQTSPAGAGSAEYAVTALRFVATMPERTINMEGSGTYSTGPTNRMVLQLTIDGETHTYDSGPFTPGRQAASSIDITVMGNPWECAEYDLHIVASPDAAACYANCDGSVQQPILNVQDFTCFLDRFAAGDPYANCDGSQTQPILNVADFSCFLQTFSAGCP
jgi:hypothetical protein